MPIITDIPIGDIWLAGDHHFIDGTVMEEGVPVPLAGYDCTFTAKLNKNDADNAFGVIQKTVGNGIEYIDAANGLFMVTLSPADTSSLMEDTTFYYDIQFSKSDGSDTFTFATGTMKIVADITQKS